MNHRRHGKTSAEHLARLVICELDLAGLPWVRAGQAGPAAASGSGVSVVLSCYRGRALYLECLGAAHHPSRADRRRRERFQAENAIYLELREAHLVARTIRVVTAQIAAQTAA